MCMSINKHTIYTLRTLARTYKYEFIISLHYFCCVRFSFSVLSLEIG